MQDKVAFIPSCMSNINNMKRVTLFFAFLLLSMLYATAQEKMITIKGAVSDAKTKVTLPGVTIHVQGKQIFTQSNGDGKYVIKVPEKLRNANIIFNVFGYARDTMVVKDLVKHPNVKLKSGGGIKLQAVTVKEYTPQSLVKEVVNRIPKNYWCDTSVGTYFYRDCRQMNDELYLFDEMVFDALRVGYDKYNTIEKTVDGDGHSIRSNYKAILFSRMLVNDTAYVKKVTKGGGGFWLTYSDKEVLVDPFEMPNTTSYLSTSKRSLKSWNYKMESFTDPDNVEYYLVTMTKNVSSFGPTEYVVVLTIRKSDLAVTKLDYTYDSKENDYSWPIRALNQKVGRDSVYYYDHRVYNYGEVDGKMTLTSYTEHHTADFFYNNDTMYGQRELHLAYDAQCVLTAHRRGDARFFNENNIQSTVRVAVSERQAGELRYDEEFWKQYNFIPLEEELLRKLEEKLGKGK